MSMKRNSQSNQHLVELPDDGEPRRTNIERLDADLSVHTRQPRRLHAELGWCGAVGFHALMGGLILSALVHPFFYALLAYFLITGELFLPAESSVGATFRAIAWINLAVGYVISILIGMISVCRRRRFRLILSSLLMPVYWLLISLAAYRALYQLVRNPYLWEKTEHRGEARR